MATPIFVLDQPAALTVFLSLSATGAGATGLTFSDVTCDYREAGAGSFTSKSLDATNFTEIGSGWYEIDFTAGEIDTAGNFVVRVDGATIDMSVVVAYVAEEAPAPGVPAAPPTTVPVFGWVYDATGAPVEDASVAARLVAVPTVTASSAVIASGTVSTRTDSTGYFVLNLAVGVEFDVFIPDANYRRMITVPVASANLFDIE